MKDPFEAFRNPPDEMMEKCHVEVFIMAVLTQLAKNLNKQAEQSNNSLKLYKQKQTGELEEQRLILKTADITTIAVCSALQDALTDTVAKMAETFKT